MDLVPDLGTGHTPMSSVSRSTGAHNPIAVFCFGKQLGHLSQMMNRVNNTGVSSTSCMSTAHLPAHLGLEIRRFSARALPGAPGTTNRVSTTDTSQPRPTHPTLCQQALPPFPPNTHRPAQDQRHMRLAMAASRPQHSLFEKVWPVASCDRHLNLLCTT